MWGETYQHYCVVTGKDQEHISEAHTLYAYAIMSVHVVEEDDSPLPQALLLLLLLFQALISGALQSNIVFMVFGSLSLITVTQDLVIRICPTYHRSRPMITPCLGRMMAVNNVPTM